MEILFLFFWKRQSECPKEFDLNLSLKLRRVNFLAVVLGLVVLSFAPILRAQAAGGPDDGWHVAITPYIWFAGVHGTTGVHGHEASVHASASDVLSYVNIGLMGAVEARYKRIIVPIDFMWIKLADEKGLPFEQGPTSIKVKMNQTIFTPKVGYRIIKEERVSVDGVVGIRYWHVGNTLTLEPTQPLGGFYAAANWVDVVAGAKMQFLLTPKVVVTVLGDAGGGQANSDYQVAGVLGYRLNKKWILQAGYRYLSVNYRPASTFVYNLNQSGVVLGATINLK
jgi:hypothetical protein